MPVIVIGGKLNVNSPQENAGTFAGQYNTGGWDANIKVSEGCGAHFGFFNVVPIQVNVCLDNFQAADGIMNDQDIKPQFSGNT
ncbi:hypothetical protein [Alicyclobacillus mengziensis]|uniref:Uncharacterized protein n=1 Tax=Alicyclobacillus mengziensis TaxID=2931921 RepID=A0A9X7W039_9BACL|nr:hypothetical protein [Alicyclobacillus mengziensis]QSO48268.1 hypothetical protein JZ786_04540 [Alicyclobacillus mengziensis]